MSDDNIDDFIDPKALREHLREETDLQVGSGARDKLVAQLENVAFSIWNQAAIIADDADDKRIQEEHVEKAFGDLVKHQEEIDKAAREVRRVYSNLESISNQTPLYVEYTSDNDE